MRCEDLPLPEDEAQEQRTAAKEEEEERRRRRPIDRCNETEGNK